MTDLSKWWAGSISDLVNFYKTDIRTGLSEKQVQKNAERFGKNTFAELKPASAFFFLLKE